ncbi:S-adenosyl-L-methionine-dependent methyltransferase [Sesbania bispinosa]|nr:S-adenosyl-L-methionine-dependent methyltransferase [Sesbania bispinosa]
MDKEIDTFLKKLSFGAIAIASVTLLSLFLRTPDSCVPPDAPPKPHLRFPKSSCDFHSTRPHVPLDKKNHRLWSSRDWRNKVHSFSLLFFPLRDLGLLRNHSKVLCISASAGHEVAAMSLLGVEDVTGVELLDSPPLVQRADPHNLPFFDEAFDLAFTARFDLALFPARFAAEMERTVRPGGVCFVLVEECGIDEVREVVRLFRNSKLVSSSNVTLIGMRMTGILMRTRKSSS